MKHQLFRLLIAFFVTVFLITIIPQQIFADETSADLDPLKKKAEQGHAGAQLNLGLMYSSGKEGVPQDYRQAVYWYTKAAEQGHAGAQNNLGLNYYSGEAYPRITNWPMHGLILPLQMEMK